MDFSDYTGCKIIVYDDMSNLTIAETKIVEFDKGTHTATMERSAFHGEFTDRVSVLIFYKDGLCEYKATIRKVDMLPGFIGLALYRGKTKEERASKRYTLNIPAVVEHFVIVGRLVPLRKPLEILVINLSATGCLIRGNLNFFNVGTVFQLKIKTDDSTILLSAKVIHILNVDTQSAEYGCQFELESDS